MKVKFRFTDGVEYEHLCDGDENILNAALRSEVPLLSQCQSGSCGTCVARLLTGEVKVVGGESSSLLKSEREAGLRLTCQSKPVSDCVFEVDYDSSLGEVRPEAFESNIEDIEWLSNDVVRLRLALPEDDYFNFEPGQFLQVRVPGTDHWRSYSMASGMRDMPNVTLLIRILPDGVMSNYLNSEAEPGDLVELQAPFGSFRLRKSKAPHIFVAGGTGLAPFLSMFEAIRRYSGSKPPMLLSFGCANDAGLFAVADLEDAAFMLPTLSYRISVEQKLDADTDAVIGNPVEAITADDVTSKDSVAYLCGPPAMIEAARTHLSKIGVSPDNIFSEQFVSSG